MAIVLALLGALSILYGVSVMLIHSGTAFFAVWYVIGACLLAAAWATHVGAWAMLPSFARRAGVVVLALCLACLALTQGLIVSQFNAKGQPDLDYIVVLGAQVRPDGMPSAVLQYRLDAALDYLAENPQTTCIVSGGQGGNEPMAEADGMAAYLEEHGISPQRILRENRSLNTAQNVAYSMELFDAEHDQVGIVTNNFHVFRATRIAQRAGVQNICGIAAYSTPLYQPNNMLREGLGLAKDFLAGNL